MEPLAPHEKLFVDTDFLEEDENHGSMECHECHGGDPKAADWRTAHKGLIKDRRWTAPVGIVMRSKTTRRAFMSALNPIVRS